MANNDREHHTHYSTLSCVHNWRVDAVRLRFMRAQTRAQAFTKKQQFDSYLGRATPSSTNLLTPPVKVTGMYGTRLIRAENSNMLNSISARFRTHGAPKASNIRTNAWFHAYTRQL